MSAIDATRAPTAAAALVDLSEITSGNHYVVAPYAMARVRAALEALALAEIVVRMHADACGDPACRSEGPCQAVRALDAALPAKTETGPTPLEHAVAILNEPRTLANLYMATHWLADALAARDGA